MEYVPQEDVDIYLKPTLHDYAVSVRFVKKDGTVRTMLCTLKPEFLPPVVEVIELFNPMAPVKKTNPDVQTVYDLEAKAWRSFNKSSVCGYSVEDYNLPTINKEAQ